MGVELIDIAVQAICPKKRKEAPQPSVELEDAELASRRPADSDDNLAEAEQQRQGLLAK